MKATVFYPIHTDNISIRNIFDYDLGAGIIVHNKETGERFTTDPSRDYYQAVGEYEDDGVTDYWQFLEDVFSVFNTVKNRQVSEKIRNGELEVSHSSMSMGDIVVIDGVGSFITAGIGFDEIEF